MNTFAHDEQRCGGGGGESISLAMSHRLHCLYSVPWHSPPSCCGAAKSGGDEKYEVGPFRGLEGRAGDSVGALVLLALDEVGVCRFEVLQGGRRVALHHRWPKSLHRQDELGLLEKSTKVFLLISSSRVKLSHINSCLTYFC